MVIPVSSARVGGSAQAQAPEQERTSLSAAALAESPLDEMRTPLAAQTDAVTHARVKDALGQLPLHFIENQGQHDEQVAYYARQRDADLYFTAQETVMVLADTVLRQRFVGADPDVGITGAQEQEASVNVLRGDSGRRSHTDAPSYGAVTYHDLYPGVDLTYTGRNHTLGYRFVVQPGIDPEAIRLAYAGADEPGLAENGDLLIMPEGGETSLRNAAPRAHQDIDGQRLSVGTAFRLYDDGTCGFTVGDYEPDHPVTIQSQLSHSTFLGGGGYDGSIAIALDGAGNVYVTGETTSSNFPTTSGAYDETVNGTSGTFVSVLDPTLSTLRYSTLLGGSGSSRGGQAIALDGAGNVYVTGYTDSTDFPITAGAYGEALNGLSDAFVSVLDPTLSTLRYSTFLGESASEEVYGMALDGAGNVYVTGYTDSSDFPTTAGAYEETNSGIRDAFVSVLDPTLSTLRYSTLLGGSSSDYAFVIALDGAGRVYLAGETSSDDFPTTAGAYDETLHGDRGAFVSVLDSTLATLRHSTFLEGGSFDYPRAIALDATGNVYVTGYTSSSDFPTTPGAYDQASNGNREAFLSQLDSTLSTLLHSTFLGGSASDEARAITLDGAGNVYVAGETRSSDFPTTAGAYDEVLNGDSDTFVSALDSTLSTLRYSTFLGGSGSGRGGEAIALDGAGNVYVTGYTTSSDFPTTGDAYDQFFNGSRDAFVSVLQMETGSAEPAPFLELPIAHDSFAQAAQGNVSGEGPGRVNSWFDHSYPDYNKNNRLTRWDGSIFDFAVSLPQQGVSWYDGHDGIDFSRDRSVPSEEIFAAASGAVFKTVTWCGEDDRRCGDLLGNQVWIDHDNGYATVYGHLDTVHVTTGTWISEPASQPLGTMGNSGNSDGTHLHFAVYHDHNGDGTYSSGEVVDPYGWSGAGTDPWAAPGQYLWNHRLWTQATAGVSGTSISSPSGNVAATIPAEALTTTLTLELWDTPPAAVPSAQLRSTGRSFWLRVLEWLVGGETVARELALGETATPGFEQPVTLEVSYAVTDVLHLDQNQLTAYRWDDATSSWAGLTTTVDTGQHQVIAATLEMGSFDLQAPLLCPGDDREPDDTYDAAGSISADGTPVTRLFDIPEDEDWFRLQTVAGALYTLETQDLADEVATLLSIYDLDGLTLLASDESSGGGNESRLVWRAPKTGVYFVRVTPASGSAHGCTAAYEVVGTVEYQTYLPLILRNR
ncbi:MAG: SBBP repeat-containing protein [Anaerolineae bacterium]